MHSAGLFLVTFLAPEKSNKEYKWMRRAVKRAADR
jgi:hypothetical protein